MSTLWGVFSCRHFFPKSIISGCETSRHPCIEDSVQFGLFHIIFSFSMYFVVCTLKCHIWQMPDTCILLEWHGNKFKALNVFSLPLFLLFKIYFSDIMLISQFKSCYFNFFLENYVIPKEEHHDALYYTLSSHFC